MKKVILVLALLIVAGCSKSDPIDRTLGQSIKVFDTKGILVSCQMVHSGNVKSYSTGMIHVVGYPDSTQAKTSYEAQFPNTYKAIVSTEKCK